MLETERYIVRERQREKCCWRETRIVTERERAKAGGRERRKGREEVTNPPIHHLECGVGERVSVCVQKRESMSVRERVRTHPPTPHLGER